MFARLKEVTKDLNFFHFRIVASTSINIFVTIQITFFCLNNFQGRKLSLATELEKGIISG